MGIMDKIKELLGTAREQAAPYVEKSKEAAAGAAVKAAPYVEKTRDFATDAADKVLDASQEAEPDNAEEE